MDVSGFYSYFSSDIWSTISAYLELEDKKKIRMLCLSSHDYFYKKNQECANKIASRVVVEYCSKKNFKIKHISNTLAGGVIRWVSFLSFKGMENEKRFFKNINAITSLFPSLQGLCISGISLPKKKKNIESSFQQLPSQLRELQWDNSRLNDDDIAYLSCLKGLEKLSISENPKITGASFDKVTTGLKELNCKGCRLDQKINWSCFERLEKIVFSGDEKLVESVCKTLPSAVETVYVYTRMIHLRKINDDLGQYACHRKRALHITIQSSSSNLPE